MRKTASKRPKLRKKKAIKKISQPVKKQAGIDWSGPLILIGSGLIIASLWFNLISEVAAKRDTILERSRMELSRSQTSPRRFSVPVEVSVGNILSMSLLPGTYNDGDWSLDDNLPLYLQTAAFPGENGHIIIYGHNTPKVFGTLNRTKIGEKVTVRLANGSKREYAVTEIHTVRTDQVEFLQETNYELLTLYTCSGPLDRYRLLIQAMPAETTEAEVATVSASLPQQ